MSEIETIRVSSEEFKENMDYHLELKETTRIVVLHGDEPMLAIGPWLPGERRTLPPRWFWDEIFPPQPIDHTNRASRAILEDRGVIPRSTEMRPLWSSSRKWRMSRRRSGPSSREETS